MSPRIAARQQFGQHAEKYRKSSVHGDKETLEYIVNALAPDGSERAVDVGCGGGHMSTALAARVKELVAIDVTPQMLVQTGLLAGEKGLSNVIGCLADAQSLPFASCVFDIVTCRIVLHHVLDAGRAIREMGRILKVGGKLFIQDILGIDNAAPRNYMDEIERLRDPSHIRDYAKEEWERFFNKAELEIVHREILPGSYRLKDWAWRSGTPVGSFNLIVRKLEDMPENVKRDLKATYRDGDWTIPMRYILAFTTKNQNKEHLTPMPRVG